MTPEQFMSLVEKKRAEIENLQKRIMPVKGGAIAKAHFQDNFRKGGFVNNGLQPWVPAKRINEAKKKASSRYKTLLSGRNHLYSAITYTPGLGEVVLINNTPYAAIHNEGGTINIPQRQHEMYFTRKGRITFKHAKLARYGQKVTIRQTFIEMPKRQFMGESRELNDKIEKKMDAEVRFILKQQ